MDQIMESLKGQGVDQHLLREIQSFRERYPVDEELQNRVSRPMLPYYGKEIFEMAAYALLEGQNKKYTCRKPGMGVWKTFL